ncbi:MAG: transporter substrate-binding domain-containing protein [Thiobacillus sp.]|nr:transporter substrate-binding domain-containing protein [Thiobacillus sp.]
MVASIAKQLGVRKVDSKDFGSWENAQGAARSGQADVIFGIYKNDERATYLNYIAPPFMLDPVVVVVRKGEGFAFRKWEDLKGRRGVTNAGESYGNRFDAFMTKELMVARAQGVEKAFEALLRKQADYMIIGLYPGKREIAPYVTILARKSWMTQFQWSRDFLRGRKPFPRHYMLASLLDSSRDSDRAMRWLRRRTSRLSWVSAISVNSARRTSTTMAARNSSAGE